MSATPFLFGRSNPMRSLLGRFAAAPTTLKARPVPSVSADAAPVGTPRKKILLVDDDPVTLKTTSMKLESQGYAVITALEGAAAINAVRTQKPDLILLDLCFPPDVGSGGCVAWDGFLIMSWLRRLDESRNLPFIVISGGGPGNCEERSLAHGAVAFFHKPVDHDSLLSLIERTMAEVVGSPQTRAATSSPA
jgi:CheY-like chemotaxis protein